MRIIRLRVAAPVPELYELFFPPRQQCVHGLRMYLIPGVAKCHRSPHALNMETSITERLREREGQSVDAPGYSRERKLYSETHGGKWVTMIRP